MEGLSEISPYILIVIEQESSKYINSQDSKSTFWFDVHDT